MNGDQILNEVRVIIGEMTYSRYNEINRAYREIGRLCHHNWLRGQTEDALSFADGESTYWIDLSNIRALTGVWVKGIESGTVYWHELQETPRESFEERSAIHIQPDGTDRESRPQYFKILEMTDQSIKIEVTPVPDQTYSAKIEYIRNIEDINRAITPSMPEAYHDIIADMAAGYILRRNPNPKQAQRGVLLEQQARQIAVNGLVRDSHTNRIKSISRPRRSVNEFI